MVWRWDMKVWALEYRIDAVTAWWSVQTIFTTGVKSMRSHSTSWEMSRATSRKQKSARRDLPDGLGLVPSTHTHQFTTACSSSSRVPLPSGLCRQLHTQGWHVHRHKSDFQNQNKACRFMWCSDHIILSDSPRDQSLWAEGPRHQIRVVVGELGWILF